jgi:GST-like protein
LSFWVAQPERAGKHEGSARKIRSSDRRRARGFRSAARLSAAVTLLSSARVSNETIESGGIMLKFYYNTAPNPMKVALFLEESGLPYEPVPIDTRKGEQHKAEFLAINPNAKMPAIVDGDVTVFDSSAILLYLAEKTGKFLPANTPKLRGELLSWMLFVASGVGPYSGQSVHFRRYAPEKMEYAVNRYTFEARRHYGILDARLSKQRYLVGDDYSIADINAWGWTRTLPVVLGEDKWSDFPNLKRMVDEITERPAVARVKALMERHKFKTDNDDEALRALFPHRSVKVA